MDRVCNYARVLLHVRTGIAVNCSNCGPVLFCALTVAVAAAATKHLPNWYS
jgi:hypothetical protein